MIEAKLNSEPNGLLCQECGRPLTGKQRKWCSPKCQRLHWSRNNPEYKNGWIQENQGRIDKQNQERLRIIRLEALLRLASLGLGKDGKVACAHCGCPDIDVIDIAHCNDDGAEHRKEIRGTIYNWILEATGREILDKNVRLECRNCNAKKWRTGRYPSEYELPKWAELK